jgi:hypothetical protein
VRCACVRSCLAAVCTLAARVRCSCACVRVVCSRCVYVGAPRALVGLWTHQPREAAREAHRFPCASDRSYRARCMRPARRVACPSGTMTTPRSRQCIRRLSLDALTVVSSSTAAFPPPRPWPAGAAAPAQPPRSPCERARAAASRRRSCPRDCATCRDIAWRSALVGYVCVAASVSVRVCVSAFVPSARACVGAPHVPPLGCGRTDSEKLHGSSPLPMCLWSLVPCAVCAACTAGRVPKRHDDRAALPLAVSAFGVSR